MVRQIIEQGNSDKLHIEIIEGLIKNNHVEYLPKSSS
jgi:hypothetical protein